MRRPGGVPVGVAIEATNALHPVRSFRLAIGGGVELLLRELRNQKAEPFEVLGVENAAEDFLKISDGDKFPLRNVAEVRPSDEKNGGREFGQEMVGQIEVEVEPLEPGDGFDLVLREKHAAGGVVGVRQRQKAFWEAPLVADLVRRHASQLFPCGSIGQFGGGPNLDGL